MKNKIMTYLQGTNELGQNVYAAISDEKIETLNVCDTYDSYGQKIGSDAAGDYMKILTEAGAKIANDAWNEIEANEEDEYEVRFEVGDNILAYDDSELFDLLVKNGFDEDDIAIEHTTCEGFTFWNGNNFETIVIQGEGYNPEWSVVDDEELINELDTAIENMGGGEEGHGIKTYLSEDEKWYISQSFWQGSWSRYDIRLKEDVEAEYYYQ